MPFEPSEIDKQMIDTIAFVIEKTPNFAGGTSGLDEFIGRPLPFQFPPKITADSKGANWNETNSLTYEPIVFWGGGTSRKLTIDATYIIDGSKKWTGDYIDRLAHATKAYFYRSCTEAYKAAPIVTIYELYGSVGGGGVNTTSTWRMSNVDVSHNKTLVHSGDILDSPRNQLTKITFNLLAWTNKNTLDKPKEKVEELPGLSGHPTPTWY